MHEAVTTADDLLFGEELAAGKELAAGDLLLGEELAAGALLLSPDAGDLFLSTSACEDM